MGSLDFNFIAIVLVLSPLFAAFLIGMLTSRVSPILANILTSGSVVLSALCTALVFNHVALSGNIIHLKLFEWFNSGIFTASWSIYIDVLTAVMLVVVTSVSALVHIYSIGYMSHDPHRQRFMCYLSLFTFCMLMLVTSDNFIQLFFGWEGVGVCSYLLIGFWFKKASANAAAIKAFLVNRVGDFGFALGIFMVFWFWGTVDFDGVFPNVSQLQHTTINFLGHNVSIVTMTCLLLFMGAMGKSAQLGLHTWLPDAMEGPTPVSALIHAATMVTAGVFMVARCSPIFEYSEVALSVVTCVGAFTCFFAATVALVQNDIKKIIAYSTCSQLGYMFFACGVSAYSAGVFHLMTHGFFKALLFLSAGSVIHAMSDEQDIRKMGGIWKKIPFTYAMMWIGSLALAGIFPFAGFYSKDIILEAAIASNSEFAISTYSIGLLAAVMTAFYSWRLIILSFHGKARASNKIMSHVHESPLVMTIPLFLLAIGAVYSGYWGAHTLDIVNEDGAFWRGAIFVLAQNNSLANIENINHIYAVLPLLAGIFGILLAYVCYIGKGTLPQIISSTFNRTYTFLVNKWYFDELFHYLFVKPAKKLGRSLWKKADAAVIDGIPNGLASITFVASKLVSVFQTGFVYQYAFVMISGLLFLLVWTIFFMF
ncbi:MAG: NADH-quinone oxidoreductase subunit L [Alphaproteobacteria bacterium]|jgi:NADH-quinone oxidoreductase subunit L|nr:NADH-quinone oxidoreductase subunit L [Candidatus Jidaibacter sp.]